MFPKQLIKSNCCLFCVLLSAHSLPRIPCSGHLGFLCFLTILCSFLSLGLYNLFSPGTLLPIPLSLLASSFHSSGEPSHTLLPPPFYFQISCLIFFPTHHFSLPENPSAVYSLFMCCLFPLEVKLHETRESCHWRGTVLFPAPRKATNIYQDGSVVKNWPAVRETQETQVVSLAWEDPLEEDMSTHSSIFAWRIPWTQEPGGL